MKILPVTLLTAVSLALSLSQTPAQVVVNLNSSWGYIEAELDGSNASFINPVTDGKGNFIGAMGGGPPATGRMPILAFTLPTLDNAQLDSAVITFDMRSSDAVDSDPWFSVDAYGFTSAPSTADWFAGASDPTKTLVEDNVLTTATTNGETITIDATAFLDPLYSGATPTVPTVYFRLNPDAALTAGDDIGRYRPILTNGSGVSQTTLTLTAIPEPSTGVVMVLGLAALGFFAARSRRKA